jgi:hypothetical protein
MFAVSAATRALAFLQNFSNGGYGAGLSGLWIIARVRS